MTTLAVGEIAESTVVRGFWTRSRRVGLAFTVLGLLAAVFFGWGAKAGVDAKFAFTTDLTVPVPARPGAVGFGLLTAACGVALFAGAGKRYFGWLMGGALVGLLLSFLCWQVGGLTMPVEAIAEGTFNLALPLIFGALAGVVGERTGVINIAIEGQLITGAFLGALVATIAGSIWAGLIAAAVGGLLIALMLAVLAIKYLVDQVVLGVVLNVFALGLTGFLYERLMQPNPQAYNQPPIFPSWRIPGLADIPVVGPVLFDANIFVYLAVALVIILHVGLFHTRWGLRTRAVGEHPTAADTVGIRVRLTRYRNVLLGGLIAGVGGAYFTIGATGAFNKNMTAGKGFIALAAVIFGRFSPTGALLAALLFGFADELNIYLSSNNSPIPSQFLSMLPYIATIFAVAGLVGRVRAPAADGKPY